jgi:hypothetical protein
MIHDFVDKLKSVYKEKLIDKGHGRFEIVLNWYKQSAVLYFTIKNKDNVVKRITYRSSLVDKEKYISNSDRNIEKFFERTLKAFDHEFSVSRDFYKSEIEKMQKAKLFAIELEGITSNFIDTETRMRNGATFTKNGSRLKVIKGKDDNKKFVCQFSCDLNREKYIKLLQFISDEI